MTKGTIHLRLRDHFTTEEAYIVWLIDSLRQRADDVSYVAADTAEIMLAAADELEKVVFG